VDVSFNSAHNCDQWYLDKSFILDSNFHFLVVRNSVYCCERFVTKVIIFQETAVSIVVNVKICVNIGQQKKAHCTYNGMISKRTYSTSIEYENYKLRWDKSRCIQLNDWILYKT